MKDFLRPNLSEVNPKKRPPNITPKLKTIRDVSGRTLRSHTKSHCKGEKHQNKPDLLPEISFILDSSDNSYLLPLFIICVKVLYVDIDIDSEILGLYWALTKEKIRYNLIISLDQQWRIQDFLEGVPIP